MEVALKRKQIHDYIDKADERFLALVYSMVKAELEIETDELPESHKRVLDLRLAAHYKNPSEGKEWEEIKKNLVEKHRI